MCLCCKPEKQETVVNWEFFKYRDNHKLDYGKLLIDI